MKDDRIRDLIERTADSDGELAWTEFLDEYSATIQQVIRRFERDPDRQSDCFVFVCERLTEERARRLRAFDPRGPASFSTWLMAVVSNLAVDWRRSVLGRYRPFSSILRLERLEVDIFRSVIEGGTSLQQAWASLRHEHPGLTFEQIVEVVDELHSKLTSRQNWLLATRRPEVRSIESLNEDAGGPDASIFLANGDENPEERARRVEEHRLLEAAMASLAVEERLAIRLRFQEGMSLSEVGRLMGLGDPFRARRLLDRAVTKLRRHWADATAPEQRRKT